MIKDDQEGTRNPYKCVNATKQDAMDDKIIERCKTCDNRSRSCRAAIERKLRNLDGSRIYQESIE